MFYFLFSLYFFAEYQEPYLRWQPIRYQTLYRPPDFNAKRFHNPGIEYLTRDNSVILINDITFTDDQTPAKYGIVARKGYINFRTNGSSNIDWLNPVLVTDPISETGDFNPAVVVDQKTGTILVIWNGDKTYEDSNANEPARIYFSKSTDDGFTWTPRKDITNQLYSSLCSKCTNEQKNWFAMNISSGSGLQLREGRIIFPVVVRYSFPYGPTKNFFVITDDLGENWFTTTDGPVTNCIQAKAVELNNHNVLLAIGQNGTTKLVYSENRAENWKNFGSANALQNGNSNLGFKRYTSTLDGYDRNRLLVTMPNNENGQLRNLNIFLSYDEGGSWPNQHVIEWGASGYSSIATTPNGDILVFYERGDYPYELLVANFSLEYLTDGQDSYKKPQSLSWCLSADQSDKCPEGSNILDYKIFDNQIDSFPIYAKDVQIVLLDEFRDFTIDLSKDGMETATISNLNNRVSVTFKGSSNRHRKLTFRGNFDLFINKENSEFIDFTLDDTVKLNIVEAQAKLLESKESSSKDDEGGFPLSVALAISCMCIVAGLFTTLTISRFFSGKKEQESDNSFLN